MAPKSKKNAMKMCRQTGAENDHKTEPNRMPNEDKMEPTRHPKINVFFDGFPKASGNIGGSAGGSAAGPRVSHFLQPTPQGGAILSKNIIQKTAKTE